MRNQIYVVLTFLLTGCAQARPPDPPPATAMPGLISRELTAPEKVMLARSLAVTLKDPDSAQFRWNPVQFLPGSKTTEYCAMVNARNSYGGYNGFSIFHSVLTRNEKGQYSNGVLDYIVVENAHGEQLQENLRYLNRCITAGYS